MYNQFRGGYEMDRITKQAKSIVHITTSIWALVMMIVSFMMYFNIEIHTHQSINILLEFSKAITLWYVLSILTAFFIDTTIKKKQ